MLRRAVNYVVQLRQAPHRVRVLEGRVAALEQAMRDRTQDLIRVSTRSREHTEAAVAAAQVVTLSATREHTEAAVAAAQVMNQSAFEAACAHTDAAREAAREHADAASEAVRVNAQRHAEQLSAQTRDEVLDAVSTVRRELRTQQRLAGWVATEVAGRPPASAVTSTVDPGFYVALEDRFRGSVAEIAERQRSYVEIVSGCVDDGHPVIDLGCGRGEWLRLLRGARIRAIGVDNNAAFVAENVEDGLEVVDADLMTYLAAAADDSAGAITLFQVIEHLDTPTLLRLLDEALRVLRPGGVFLAETPNALNVTVSASTFWIDPTHVRPLHPEFLKFCALHAGFAKVDGVYVNELDPDYQSIRDDSIRRLAERFDGPGDFALLAWK